MPSLRHVVNARTGRAPDPAMLNVLCNGDVSAKLAAGGLDPRPYFDAVPSHPLTLHIVHGAFAASMYRPTRRERLRGWWYTHRWPLLRGLVLAINLLALYLAVCLVMDGANLLADWLSR
jgi:hypothetical protein